MNIPGIKPFVVTATRKGEALPADHYTASFDTEPAAREYITGIIPPHYDATVYKITARAIPPDHHERAALIARNGRWGTCVECPRDALHRAYPEQCKHTSRYDHNISPEEY